MKLKISFFVLISVYVVSSAFGYGVEKVFNYDMQKVTAKTFFRAMDEYPCYFDLIYANNENQINFREMVRKGHSDGTLDYEDKYFHKEGAWLVETSTNVKDRFKSATDFVAELNEITKGNGRFFKVDHTQQTHCKDMLLSYLQDGWKRF